MFQKLRFHFTSFIVLISITMLGSLSSCKAQPAALSLNAQSKTIIVLPQNATLPERSAALELDDYLTKITGGTFETQTETAAGSTPGSIYVGNTQFATRAGADGSTLASEAWRIKTQNGNLILVGGGTRGTLYATYHFLEDVAGVRWWNPWEETVPTLGVLPVRAMDVRGKPSFSYRDIYMTYGHDEGAFAIRSRLNRDGDAPIGAQYGGSRDYGPPYHVHTFFKILSPAKYCAEHPDWFVVRGEGVPTVTTGELAMSNPAMRREFLKNLREIIRQSHQDAKEKNLPLPDVFSVSQEDNDVSFATPADAALLAENGGAESAILLDFINFLADNIKDEFPDVYIDTLAYFTGEKAPTKIRPRDNVIIRLCDTQGNPLLPITAERNHAFRENVESWSKITRNLRVWHYNITFKFPSVPTPTLATYAPTLRFLRAHNVEGVFTEFEYPLTTDMRDMKVWVLCKLLEDPNRDGEALKNEFIDGYYGAAAPHVREYLTLLNKAAETSGADIGGIFPALKEFTYLTLDFLQKSNAIYERATQAVASDPIHALRLRRARYSVDDATLKLFPTLIGKWVAAGNAPADFPFNRDEIAKRCLQVQYEQINLQLPEASREDARWLATTEVNQLTAGPVYTPPPAKFRDLPFSDITIYGAQSTRNHANHAQVIQDPQAESGSATRLVIDGEPEAEREKYKLPMPWGIYNPLKYKYVFTTGEIKAEDIPGAGYHWYKMGDLPLESNDSYLHFFWSWYIQIDLANTFDKANPDQQYEVWANLKFEGPMFPHGTADEKNAISLERVVLVKK
jgi:hypothetical protein